MHTTPWSVSCGSLLLRLCSAHVGCIRDYGGKEEGTLDLPEKLGNGTQGKALCDLAGWWGFCQEAGGKSTAGRRVACVRGLRRFNM